MLFATHALPAVRNFPLPSKTPSTGETPMFSRSCTALALLNERFCGLCRATQVDDDTFVADVGGGNNKCGLTMKQMIESTLNTD
jgi:hypothetical protein